jgi:hypothetical protein
MICNNLRRNDSELSRVVATPRRFVSQWLQPQRLHPSHRDIPNHRREKEKLEIRKEESFAADERG